MNPKTLVAISFIENNLHHAIGVAEIARSVRLSRSRLSYLFGTQIGMPPGRYLKKLRMEKAGELLETSFLSVKEIAAKVGYNDCTHFMRDFQESLRIEAFSTQGGISCSPGQRQGVAKRQEDWLANRRFR